jgi:hypothetical protein
VAAPHQAHRQRAAHASDDRLGGVTALERLARCDRRQPRGSRARRPEVARPARAAALHQLRAGARADRLVALAEALLEPDAAAIQAGYRRRPRLDWIIVGGESTQAAKARDFRVEWAMRTISMCRTAGVPVFVKQMGARVLDRNDAGFDGCDARSWPLRADGCDPDVDHEPHDYVENYQGADCRIRLVDRAGADPAEWPEVLRVREFPR